MAKARNTRTERICPTCDGAGSVTRNDSYRNDPQTEYDVPCPQAGCDDGWIRWAPVDPMEQLKHARQHARFAFGATRYGEIRQRAMSPVHLPADRVPTLGEIYAALDEVIDEHRRQLDARISALKEARDFIFGRAA